MHNLYGQPTARLSRCQSRFFEPEKKESISIVAKIICVALLFNQPKTFYHKLCDTWVDKTVYIDQWRNLLRGMQEEWTNTGFMATVILATNMGFLSIDKLDNVDLPLVSQTASVVSTILSIGSIVSGMLLVRRHRQLDTDTCTAEEASDYMTACAYYKWLGLLGAASLFSAPRALLLWSLMLFVSALLSFSFWKHSKIFSPFIAFATLTIILVILVQLWYFNTELSKSKSSSWAIPTEYKRPYGRPPLLQQTDALRAWPVEPEKPIPESSSTKTAVGSSDAWANPRFSWGRLRRKLTRRTTYPMSDLERGYTERPRQPIHNLNISAPAVYASPEHIQLAEIMPPPVSRRRSTGFSSQYSEPGPSSFAHSYWDGRPALSRAPGYQLQVVIPGADTPYSWSRWQDTPGIQRRDSTFD
ncbi:hypothetical protein AURDEDRAFT_144961 [Auricularia subglabra TFB-10046 SS5]|nr:hypothetical protein AURDEDRAFT_144961 [Auricularia subglabra TFB-10046 SS5]